jgi:hypothetical protein
MNEDFYRKKKLLEEFKLETLQQLQALQEEDVDKFVEKVERCQRIISIINEIDSKIEEDLSSPEKKEMKEILQEIIAVRENVSSLLLPLRDKLKQHMIREKRGKLLQNAYSREEENYPSIFLDKKN